MNTWDAEFTVDISAARKVCAAECGLAPSRIERLGEGWDNVVYLVNKKIVFRFPRRRAGVECMLAELDLLPLVKTSLRVPRFIYSSRQSRITGRPFAGYELIAGKPAWELAVTAREKDALVRPVARFLRELHSTRLPAGLRKKWDQREGWRTDVPGRLALAEKMFKKCEALGVDFGFGFQKTGALLARARFPEAGALVHGDLYALHLILDASHKPAGVIDWGDVHYGNPCVDLSIAFGYFQRELFPAFEAEYGGIPDEWKLASAFRTFCHGLSLLAYAADQRKHALEKRTLASILAGKAWIEDLS